MSWGNTYKTSLVKLNTKNNKAIRSIFFASSRESASPYFSFLNVLKHENILKLHTALLTYKMINNKDQIPCIFHNYIKLASDSHSYNTRFASKQNIHKPKIRTNYGLHTFKYFAAKVWETIPIDVKNVKTPTAFKEKYTAFLLYHQS